MKNIIYLLIVVIFSSTGVFYSGCEQITEPSENTTITNAGIQRLNKAPQTRPFVSEAVVTVSSQVNDTISVYTGTGTATHWGLFTIIDTVTEHITQTTVLVEGNDWITVANGALVHMTWFADYYDPATWVWEIIGGTGRFEGATGEGTWTGEFLPSGDLWVRYTGTITY